MPQPALNQNVPLLEDADKLLQQGIGLHQRGQLAQAKAIYEQVLKQHPKHFDALHLLGVIALQTKSYQWAIELIGSAIEVNPQRAEPYSNRGNALKELKRYEEALASYDKAIALKPDYADAYRNRGVVFKELKRYEEALASYGKAIALKPDYADAYSYCGSVLKELKRFEEALACYDKAIALKPDYADAHSNRGKTLQALKRPEEALACYDKAIAIKPDYADAYFSRGTAFNELKRFEEAIASYDKTIVLKPDYADAFVNRGSALQELKRTPEAIASYEKAIALKPDYAEAYSNRGIALNELKRFEEAIASYERAIAIKPDRADVYYNCGIALRKLQRTPEAIASYDKAIAINPGYVDAYCNKALSQLALGDFDSGWKLYEWRWKREDTHHLLRNFSQPVWTGAESLEAKTILLHAEQGLGDSIQFCRYAQLVKQRGAKVLLEVPKSLMDLLQGLEGVDALQEKGKPLAHFDYHCPLLSLPLAFKTELQTIPQPTPYLKSDVQKRRLWGEKLREKTKPRVGIVWSGNTQHKDDHNRSLTLSELIQALPEGAEYVSLQKDVREIDDAVLKQSSVKHFGHELEDFTDTAALCDLMDIVISVDTSVAHLAGALGKRTWVLLPYAPDWRWLSDREDSPWYGSIKLYRQSADMLWAPVLDRVQADVRHRLRGDY